MLRVAWWLILALAVETAMWSVWGALELPSPGRIGFGVITSGVLLAIVARCARRHLGDLHPDLVPMRGMPLGLVIPITIGTLGGLVLSVQSITCFEALSVLAPDSFGDVEELEDHRPLLEALVTGSVIPAVFEEGLFRGVVLGSLAASMSQRRALVISALFFAAVHLSIEHTLDTFVAGIVFGWLYLRTGSLLPAIQAHFIHNTACELLARADLGPEWQPWFGDNAHGFLPSWVACLGIALMVVGWVGIRMIPARRVVPAEA